MNDPKPSQEVQLEGGAYEIIRKRLATNTEHLQQSLDKLNEARKQAFGSIETKLLSTRRVVTDNNCIARDMVPIGELFLFGYNVHLGLRTETNLADVFSVYEQQKDGFHAQQLTLISDDTFHKDFHDLYKYYKATTFSKFAVIGPHLFMVFRISQSLSDIKTFKWLIGEGKLSYLDNRSEHEFKYPNQHEFEWVRTRREMFREGAHPHVSIEERLFVETVGGDLTIKVEDNTDDGSGIYEEHVDNPDQTLNDAEIFYACIGNVILLKIRPYQEKVWRYIVYNEKLKEARRIDAVADSCVLLPDSHGLIFPRGYYLLSGEFKQFESSLSSMVFEKRISAPNGEDYLYVFYNRESGDYILLSYNLIQQKVEAPIHCNGYSCFKDGTMIYFRAETEAGKHHAIQAWQTPYTDPTFATDEHQDSPIFHIGNKDIVRAMAACHEVITLAGKQDTYANLYLDIAKKCTDLNDSYFWLREPTAFGINEKLDEIGKTAQTALDEYEKVSRIRQSSQEEIKRVSQQVEALNLEIERAGLRQVDEFVGYLSQLRVLRGEIISCGERRYVDQAQIEAMETRVSEQNQQLSQGCVAFLLKDEALQPYQQKVETQDAEVSQLKQVTAARRLEEALNTTSSDLELLIEVVTNLKIDDPTQTTRIIDNISEIFSELNRIKAALKNRKQDLARQEGVAEFNAQIKLLAQSVVNYLDVSDSPDKCETYLTKLSIQIEELEGRFAEFDEFIEQLVEKREQVYNAFEAKRLALVEARNRKASAQFSSAQRILKGIRNRVSKFQAVNEINGYFAGDLMVDKLRNIIATLTQLEDTVKADDLQAQLKTIREEAVRQLKDRNELYSDGGNLINLGKHRFSVNVQNLALSVVMREGKQFYHLAGTDFFEEITDANFLATRDVWEQEVPSENKEVYRGEYLAWQLLTSLEQGDPEGLVEARDDEPALLEKVRRFMGPRYTEGYVKGVHDHDATRLLQALLELRAQLGLLAWPAQSRALATLFWNRFCPAAAKSALQATSKSLATLLELFPESSASQAQIQELQTLIEDFQKSTELIPSGLSGEAANYLMQQLVAGGPFVISREAGERYKRFIAYLTHRNYLDKYRKSLATLEDEPVKGYQVAREWMAAYCAAEQLSNAVFEDEAAVLAYCDSYQTEAVAGVTSEQSISGFKGNHKQLQDGSYQLSYNAYCQKMNRYMREQHPRFESYVRLKKQLTEEFAQELRLEEFKPRVLTSFVRNQLLDQVYLPLIGDNLAKQMGTAGAQTRTDRMGMLLLISPPGYGKTTLMEYIANRLGLIFMKINGPAIGHEVTSLDPAAAPHSAAREELKKLNLSLEMGDNVMIYLDDIQHCNPEFLQKFISLCDAQRKIEGIYKGRTRTYDLRGKKVAVVMAGNPYTESGDKFQIPDMLANRADTYNLGDIIGGNSEVFEKSYLENSLTSNPVLNKLASRGSKDVQGLIKIAETGSRSEVSLEGNYSAEEVNEFVNVLSKMFRVRDVILRVNLQYIRSAASEDAYRTEPAFKLQGSYRNMNKIAEKVLPIMNDQELENLLWSHYENEAQTLTSGAEANLLKFKELTGRLDEQEQARWTAIKRSFASKQRMHGIDSSDKIGQVVAQLSAFAEGLDAIQNTLGEAMNQQAKRALQVRPKLETHTTLDPASLERLGSLVKPLMAHLAEALKLTAAPPAERVDTSNAETDRTKEARFMLKLLRNQFEVMQHWLKPIYESTHHQQKQMNSLTAAVNNLMSTHGSLLNYLQQFQAKKPSK